MKPDLPEQGRDCAEARAKKPLFPPGKILKLTIQSGYSRLQSGAAPQQRILSKPYTGTLEGRRDRTWHHARLTQRTKPLQKGRTAHHREPPKTYFHPTSQYVLVEFRKWVLLFQVHLIPVCCCPTEHHCTPSAKQSIVCAGAEMLTANLCLSARTYYGRLKDTGKHQQSSS